MHRPTRSLQALRAAPVLVLVFALASGGGSPTPRPPVSNPLAEQGLAAATGDPVQVAAPVTPAPIHAAPTPASSSVIGVEGASETVAPNPARVEREPVTIAQAPTYSGTNHFWIPKLDMSYPVHAFPCSRSRPPDNYMYRWGCAGENNVYIMGHAHIVMKPLHDLYVRGRLKVGMLAVYANANGRVTKFRVTEWRVVDPTESAWAIADQPVPSMTLQTCVGKHSQWRLNVRLVAVD